WLAVDWIRRTAVGGRRSVGQGDPTPNPSPTRGGGLVRPSDGVDGDTGPLPAPGRGGGGLPSFAVILALVALLHAWPLLGAGQHPLTAYNPLFGGIRTAEWALPVGWGEGLDTVGAYLDAQPSDDQLQVGIWFPLWVNFQAHTAAKVHNLTFAVNGS